MEIDPKEQLEWLGEWRDENGSPIPYLTFGNGDFAVVGSMANTGVINTKEGLVLFDLPIRAQGKGFLSVLENFQINL